MSKKKQKQVKHFQVGSEFRRGTERERRRCLDLISLAKNQVGHLPADEILLGIEAKVKEGIGSEIKPKPQA